ncbi:MAG: hypothetical protein ABH825_02235, partial [Candidatus Omnitrophota bacterium]
MDYIVYIAARALSLIFILIPLRIGLLLGRGAGLLIFYVNHKRRKVAYKNLKAAFGKTKDPGQLMKITKGVYKNFGQMLIEVLRLPAMGKRYTNKFLKIRGMENLKAAQKNGKGVIFLTGHFGNWELSSAVSPLMGLSVISLAREQKHSRLNDLLNEYRQINGARIVSKGASVRELIRHLRSGGIIGMLTDQDAGKFSEFINFFDRPAS